LKDIHYVTSHIEEDVEINRTVLDWLSQVFKLDVQSLIQSPKVEFFQKENLNPCIHYEVFSV